MGCAILGVSPHRHVVAPELAVVPCASRVLPTEKPDLFNQRVLDVTAHPAAETLVPA